MRLTTRAQWHLGHVTPEYCPWRRGFSTAEGYFASGVDKFSKCAFKAPELADAPITPDVPDAWCRDLNAQPSDVHEGTARTRNGTSPHLDHSPSPQLPSPPPPPPPDLEAALAARVASLNARFRRGNASHLVSSVFDGWLAHQFDVADGSNDEPNASALNAATAVRDEFPWWRPHGGGAAANRLAASLVTSHMQPDDTGALPLYSYHLAGVIINPMHATVLCSYVQDMGTAKRRCDSGAPDCVPGCTPTFPGSPWREGNGSAWCEARERFWNSTQIDTVASSRGYGCAWAGDDLPYMMESWARLRAANVTHCHTRCQHNRGRTDGGRNAVAMAQYGERYYNEVVLGAAAFEAAMPFGVDAVFFIDGVNETACVDIQGRRAGARCEAFARDAHRQLIETFGVAATRIPLVRLRLRDWDNPLELVATQPSPPPPPTSAPPSVPPTTPAPPAPPPRTLLYDWFRQSDNENGGAPSYLSPGHPLYTSTYLPTLETQRARAIVLAHNMSHGPLFLFLSLAAVHLPLQATDDLLHRVDALRGPGGASSAYFQSCAWFDWAGLPNPTPRNPISPNPTLPVDSHLATCVPSRRRLLEAMALSIDDTLASLIDALRMRGMYDNTLLVVTSDNGGALNQQGSNKPLRGGKGGSFEGGVRVPAALAGGWLPPQLRGHSSARLMHLADWYATLSHAAGIDAVDGRSTRVARVDGLSMWSAWLHPEVRAMEDRVVIIDETLAYLEVTPANSAASAMSILKLSIADLMLCTDRTIWSKASCSPRATARATGVTNGSESLIGGNSQACSLSAPCLYDVATDEREEVLLDASASGPHGAVVARLLQRMNASIISPVDPFYPEGVRCPDPELYVSHGQVKQPMPMELVLPPRPPMPPPHQLTRFVQQEPPMPPLLPPVLHHEPPVSPRPPPSPPPPSPSSIMLVSPSPHPCPSLPPLPIPSLPPLPPPSLPACTPLFPPRSPLPSPPPCSHARPPPLVPPPALPLAPPRTPPPFSPPSTTPPTTISMVMISVTSIGLAVVAAAIVTKLWHRHPRRRFRTLNSTTMPPGDLDLSSGGGIELTNADDADAHGSDMRERKTGLAGMWQRHEAEVRGAILVIMGLGLLVIGALVIAYEGGEELEVASSMPPPSGQPTGPAHPPALPPIHHPPLMPPSSSTSAHPSPPPPSPHPSPPPPSAHPSLPPPPPPPLSPPVPLPLQASPSPQPGPPAPTSPLTILEQVNARYRTADARDALVLHQWDMTDGNEPERWWQPPGDLSAAASPSQSARHARDSDRLSASMLHARIPPDPNGLLPLYSYHLGGFVVASQVARSAMRCAFESDGATKKRDCPSATATSSTLAGGGTNGEGTTACVPGCTPTHLANWSILGDRYWCHRAWSDSQHVEAPNATGAGYFSCPWRPSDLDTMLDSWAARRAASYTECSSKCEARRARLTGDARRAFEMQRGRYYSEVVMDRAALLQEMPHAILAFFYVAGVDEAACPGSEGVDVRAGDGDQLSTPRCEAFTRAARLAIQRAFRMPHGQPPLLVLNLRDASAPFALAP